MNHIVDTCPLTKSEGGLNLLHEADDDAVIRLESTATAALAANNNQLTNCAFLCSEKDDGGRGERTTNGKTQTSSGTMSYQLDL